jgi:2-polyprenyl-3-methyl-5-hydroxy-6-metoxy-1,4-benzoquinol methylase
MVQREWFREWFNSDYYHKLYFERDEKEAQQFIDQLINHFNIRVGCRILDVACGRGRHSKYLSSLGYDVTGIDISPESIRYAKQFESENLHFYEHDMRLPFWINYFDFTFNFFTSFGYFATLRENVLAISTMAKSLRKNGILLLDYLNVHYVEDRLVAEEMKCVNGTDFEIHRWQDAEHFYKKIDIPEKENKIKSFTERICKLGVGDFNEMLSYHQMQVVEIFGDYKLSPYDIKKTPRMIIAAKKIIN